MRRIVLLSLLWVAFLSPRPALGDDKGHWAFRPPVRPAVPTVRQGERARTAIDRFILAALEAKSLSLSPEADRATLIRRVSFDLTGLPPTPAEIDAFLADPSPDAYDRMVERYLASPHYGERWGKYWLDAAGYADSNGYFNADTDRPLAWKYRDYVVRSFNADKPYDRFVTEQLAGDELAGYAPDGDVTPAMAELLAATHFLRNAPDGTGESDGNPDEVRTDRLTVLEGTLQITMNCLLGLTIQCGRCHEHKFEPIAHQEYYALQAIFFPAYNPERWTKPNDRVVSVAGRAERTAYQRRMELIDREVKAQRDSLAAAAQRLKTSADLVKLTDDDLAKRFPAFASLREDVQKTIAVREKERPPPLEKVAAFVETDPSPPPHHVLKRGQHNAPGAEVAPGVPAAFCTSANVYRPEPKPAGRVSSGRRTAFAKWVTSPENPLFARVLVNRVWQHHFGTGLVSTPDNLGRSGAKPSHPELLDYLATEFVRGGWSVKSLHRLILASAVYRQASAPPEKAAEADPDNRLLSCYPLRRLDAESLRDAMLLVSGELDQRLGGPYVASHRTADGSVEIAPSHDGARRRSVCLQQRRTQVVTLLQLFDAPALLGPCATRTTSTVPLQSLALLNSEFPRLRARAFARRLDHEAGTDPETRLGMAFRLACGRPPAAEELAAARRFLAAQAKVYAGEKDAAERTWIDLCQMVLASNAFLYVE
ncbi:MAG TPA: DUF1549 and DUF1553 domain-containing protein [Gemmataceae bacterium]|nr:DUF1549 and DUF1553 domain-containing protein [Gemmataceae bacterium]